MAVLHFWLVSGNRRPAGAVPNQYHLLETSILGEVDPGGDIPHFLTGHTPITTPADSFVPSPGQHVSHVMHPRISSNAGKTPLCQRPPNVHVRRLIKTRPPAMDPDDGERLG